MEQLVHLGSSRPRGRAGTVRAHSRRHGLCGSEGRLRVSNSFRDNGRLINGFWCFFMKCNDYSRILCRIESGLVESVQPVFLEQKFSINPVKNAPGQTSDPYKVPGHPDFLLQDANFLTL